MGNLLSASIFKQILHTQSPHKSSQRLPNVKPQKGQRNVHNYSLLLNDSQSSKKHRTFLLLMHRTENFLRSLLVINHNYKNFMIVNSIKWMIKVLN